ncbi:MAG: 50S ribosomal protein L30 [Candidatus Neomarinimicrobiota bacterium]|jgi:large subunit ribosomal protein L30
MAKKKEKQLKITQIKSTIGYRAKTRLTIEALGLGKMYKSVVLPDNPAIRGMINKIPHLLKVEELS